MCSLTVELICFSVSAKRSKLISFPQVSRPGLKKKQLQLKSGSWLNLQRVVCDTKHLINTYPNPQTVTFGA